MRRTLLALSTCLLTLLWAGGLEAALADDGAPSLPESITTTLEPGDNRIGWVAEPVSPEELFEQLPQVELVYSWDAHSSRYEIAAPRLPQRYWTLQFLEPGHSYVLRLSGPDEVEWQRSTLPARGLVELRTGENWAAWLGPDDWAITDVAKGIGGFLTEIRFGDHVYNPVNPETADDWPMVARGDAMVVTVSRGVNWLQPTYVLPKLIFAGNVGHGSRSHAKRDLVDMSTYIAEEFGVQADPFRLVVIVAGDVRSLFEELEQQGRPREYENLRNWWLSGSGGYHSGRVNVVKEEQWDINMGRYSRARYVLLEEYFHAIQFQLIGNAADRPPTWMVEGSINWIRGDLATRDRTGYPLSQRLIRALNQASQGPPLEDIETGNQTWQYSFGLVAADLLVQRAGAATMLDFFRAFAPGRTGPDGQWESQLTWQGAFAAAYGISVEEFYSEFEELMTKRRGSARRRPASNQVSLKGTIVDSDGTPRPAIRLTSHEIKNGARAAFGSAQAKSDDDGEFTLLVRKNADHRIEVRLSDDFRCKYWWSSGGNGEALSEEDAELIEVGTSDPPPLTITVDADKCRWRIRGTLTGPDDKPLAGIEIRARGDHDEVEARSKFDGTFELVATSSGSYQLFVDLDGCEVEWNNTDDGEAEGQPSLIEVLNSDATGLSFKVLEDPCTRISGRLLDADGNGISGAHTYAQAVGPRAETRTDSEGRFTLAVTEQGEHRLYAYVDGCLVVYRDEELTGVWGDAAPIAVTEDDVSGVIMQLTNDMCSLRFSGTLLNADGSRRSGTYVRATSYSGVGGDWPSRNGAFQFAVPAAGSYWISVTIEDCQIFYTADGPVADDEQALLFNLTDTDITGIEFRLPEDPASVCN